MKLYKKNIKYWIPLLEWSESQQDIIWNGKSLPLPLNKNIINSIEKKDIKIGFGLISNTLAEKGLFCKINEKTYLLGTANIFKTSNNIKEIDNLVNIFEHKDFINDYYLQQKIKSLCNQQINFYKYKLNYRGAQIKLSGRLGGANKSLRFSDSVGSFKPQSFDSNLDYYSKPIFTKWGSWGLKIYLGQ